MKRKVDEAAAREVLRRIDKGEPAAVVIRLWNWMQPKSFEWLRRRKNKAIDPSVVAFCGKGKMLAVGENAAGDGMMGVYPLSITDAGREFLESAAPGPRP